MQMDISHVPDLYKLEAARARGESISEFKIARLYVDALWPEITEMLDSGLSKTDVSGMVKITARVSRTAAYNTLINKINSAANRGRTINTVTSKLLAPSKPKIKNEVSKVGQGNAMAKPAPANQQPEPAKSAPAAEFSAPAQSSQDARVFRPSFKIGTGFHGIDDVGQQADREREEQRMAMANLDVMTKEHGNPIEFLKRQQQKENQDA